MYFTVIDPNAGFCTAGSGVQSLVGNSGLSHDVFVVREDDGSAWLRFGREEPTAWNKVRTPPSNESINQLINQSCVN